MIITEEPTEQGGGGGGNLSSDFERLLLNDNPEEMNSIQGQRPGWIAQSFCVIKF